MTASQLLTYIIDAGSRGLTTARIDRDFADDGLNRLRDLASLKLIRSIAQCGGKNHGELDKAWVAVKLDRYQLTPPRR